MLKSDSQYTLAAKNSGERKVRTVVLEEKMLKNLKSAVIQAGENRTVRFTSQDSASFCQKNSDVTLMNSKSARMRKERILIQDRNIFLSAPLAFPGQNRDEFKKDIYIKKVTTQ